jgi:hypothetical protein
MTNCDITKCEEFFRDKNCMCYSVKDTKSPKEEQICGYYENGVIYECLAGCCPGGCPSRACADAKILPKEPDGYIPEDTPVISDPQEVRRLFNFDTVFALIYIGLLVMVSMAINLEFGAGLAVVLIAVVYINRNSLKNVRNGIPVNLLQLWPLSNLSSSSLPLSPKT